MSPPLIHFFHALFATLFIMSINSFLLIALSHCNLSFYQLMYLNRKKVGTEAFCQLIYLIYTNDCFTDKDLSHFMSKNTYPAVLLASVFQYLLSLDIKADMTKKRLLEEWQKSHPNVLSK